MNPFCAVNPKSLPFLINAARKVVFINKHTIG